MVALLTPTLAAPTLVPPAAARAALARCWLAPSMDDGPSPSVAGRAASKRADEPPMSMGDVSLRPHQVAAVRQLRAALDEGGGALLADAVGLGKTFVALALAREAMHPLVVAPVGLRQMWEQAGQRTAVAVNFCSTESLGRGATPRGRTKAWDLVIVDEAHHFRNPATRRYRALARLTAGVRVLLLSATPVHNRLGDLAAILGLFLGARAWTLTESERARWVVRRSHALVAVDGGPESGVGSTRVPTIDGPHRVTLADDTATLEAVVALPAPVPPRDGGDCGALVAFGLVRQWASSAGAVRSALRRRLARAAAMESALAAGRHPSYRDVRAWCVGEGAVQLAFPELLVPESPDAPALLGAVRTHEAAIRTLLDRLAAAADPDVDRATRLREIQRAHPGARIVAFSAYEDTVRALYQHLRGDGRVCALSASGAVVAGGRLSRAAATAQFAPTPSREVAMRGPAESDRIDLLLTTDLLSEGVNLQQAAVVVHLDLPWTPARMEQRVGRIARLGSPHERVDVYAFMPPTSAETLLGIERRLRAKLDAAGRAIGVVGSIVPPLAADAGAATHGASMGPPEFAAASDAALRRWLTGFGRPDAPRADGSHLLCTAVRSETPGFLAACVGGGRPMLVASCGGPVSDAPDVVARAVALAEGEAAPVDECTCQPALDATAEWWSRRRATADAGLLVAAGAQTRRQVLARVADIMRRAGPHLRPRLSDLARRARGAATAPCGTGAEWVLDELAGATLSDHAWLRAVSAFGDSYSARRHDEGGPADALSVAALIVFVPSVSGSDSPM